MSDKCFENVLSKFILFSYGITSFIMLSFSLDMYREYQKEKNVLINDIGYWKGVRGHHVFINSELGLYMDHFKGKRKQGGASWRKDFKSQTLESTKNIPNLDYWKNVKP